MTASIIFKKTKMMIKKSIVGLSLLLLSMMIPATAYSHTTEDETARQLFEEVYNKVYGPQGCLLSYDVNLVGVYKTKGTIWYKDNGKKMKFIDARGTSWNDGKTVYMVNDKKKVINIYDANSKEMNKYTSKFKFTFDDFNYSLKEKNGKKVLVLKQKKGAKGTVKEAQVILDAKTHAPEMARVKVMLFWANIKISNFKSGGISDDLFVFPREKFSKSYKYVDNR